MGAIVTRADLESAIAELKKAGKKVITTNGCFDILHVGHVRYLKQAKALGDVLVVGVNTDASVRKLKGDSRPINPQDDRAEVLAALENVDFVSLFDEDTPVEFIKAVKPDMHVKGGDYKVSELAETPVVQALGGQMKIIPLVQGKSTTSIVNKMRSN